MTGSNKHAHGTEEWAASCVNIQNGCEHDCLYCYAKSMAIRFRRTTAKNWAIPVIRKHSVEKRYSQRKGRVMFPSTHDITPANIQLCIEVLEKLLRAKNEVLIVSKPYLNCIKELCKKFEKFQAHVLFRFSVGSIDNTILKFWEPKAPSLEQRISSLSHAYSAGFQTSVSCEPFLDTQIDKTISLVRPNVTHSIWLGKANRLNHIIPTNCPKNDRVIVKVKQLQGWQSDEYIRCLYSNYKDDPLIRWKDSIKKVIGIERPTVKGLDI